MEALKKRGEEEEELHPGQALAQTHPATCGEGHEGISSDKSALVIQEVGGVKRVRRHPFTLIIQDRSEEGDDHRPLWADRTSEGEHTIINVGQ